MTIICHYYCMVNYVALAHKQSTKEKINTEFIFINSLLSSNILKYMFLAMTQSTIGWYNPQNKSLIKKLKAGNADIIFKEDELEQGKSFIFYFYLINCVWPLQIKSQTITSQEQFWDSSLLASTQNCSPQKSEAI